MKIVEIPVILDSTYFAQESHVRTPGVHVSHIIHSIMQDTYGIFKGEDLPSEAMEAYRTAGFLFERVLYDIILKDEEVERLGEFEEDGIIMTPDAVKLGVRKGIESKCTFRSMKHDITDVTGEMADWWMQMMAYAKALGINDWELWAWFMRGDYAKVRWPVCRHLEIVFEQEEVEANWRRIKNHRDWMKETGRIR